ncbi:LAMI_0H08350g1_1 [Lachancea mirantina]|uniref:LAMI_0H08350g1_1 n=1 Tax=Lachancea mirantina TaxID=1230905 RepID=A0A1G4KG48_9SACH|nr:LAMI_0H08350g1_1 [Lachancea mirantina]
MSTFFRGPICGTDNCRSRLWRIIDGRRTCQYGHVMEGDVEFNDDEDVSNLGVVTRRLNLTTNVTGNFRSSLNTQSQLSQQERVSKKVYGRAAETLLVKSFQRVLEKQCGWLVGHGFPSVFEDTVKWLWMKWLRGLEEDGAERPGRRTLGLSLPLSIAVLYLATVHLRLPVYTCDYIRWICSMQLPYFKATRLLPASWCEKLPNYYLQLLEGGKPPSAEQLAHKIVATSTRLQFTATWAPDPFYLRMLLELRLPPEVFLYAGALSRGTNGHPHLFAVSGHVALFPEFRALGCLLLALRWCVDVPGDAPGDAARAPRPARWLRQWCAAGAAAGAADRVTRVSYGADLGVSYGADLGVSYGSDRGADRGADLAYLAWLESTFADVTAQSATHTFSIDQNIARRQLYSIFPSRGNSRGVRSQGSDSLGTAVGAGPSLLARARLAYAAAEAAPVPASHPDATSLRAEVQRAALQRLGALFALEPAALSGCIDAVERGYRRSG